MSFPKFPAYKESGVEWLGEVPITWRVVPLKHVVAMKSGEQITAEQIEEVGAYPVFGGNGLRGFTNAYTHEGNFPLIGRQGALCGNINYAVGKFWASEHAVVVKPKIPCAIIWLGELLRAMNLGQYSITAAQPGLSVEAVGNLRIAVPPATDQALIAAFLDREVDKIDALVSEQERLIALLTEKRRTVILQAVTKGLNPGTPMKPSGVEWLGDVPVHWTVTCLKRVGSLIGGAGFPIEFQGTEDGELPFYKVADLGMAVNGELLEAAHHTVSRETANVLRARVIPQNSIVYAKIGAALLLNRRRITSCECCIDNNMTAFVPNLTMIATDFAWYWLSTIDFGKVVNPGAVPSLSEGDQAVLPILVPPLVEQQKMVAFLRPRLQFLDALSSEAERAIGLLKERSFEVDPENWTGC